MEENKTYRELFVRLISEFDNLSTIPMKTVTYEAKKYFEKVEIAHKYWFINDQEYNAIQKHIENRNKKMQNIIEIANKLIAERETKGI